MQSRTKDAFDQAMLALARINVQAGESVRTAIHAVARVAVNALGVGRFSVWLTTDDGAAVRLYFLHRLDGGPVLDGTILRLEQFPSYFAALRDNRALLVPNVESDPAVAELLEGYLRPLGIGAMLDAPIWRAGKLVGVVCHEHLGGPRTWERIDREFAADVAAAVARLFEEGARVQAEDSLKIYQRQLREMNRYEGMGRLAAGVAHDLRNMLQVVDTNAEIALQETDNPELIESLETIRAAVKRSRDLAAVVLQFGRETIEGPAVVDPSDIVLGAENLWRSVLRPGHQLVIEPGRPGQHVFAVRAELERAILNLVTNARDAMPDGGTVTISVHDVEPDEGGSSHVAIDVSDTGEGMSGEVLLRAGQPFFTTRADGTGLGLAIVEQIITRAGGTLEITSEEGHGTTMRCILPRIA